MMRLRGRLIIRSFVRYGGPVLKALWSRPDPFPFVLHFDLVFPETVTFAFPSFCSYLLALPYLEPLSSARQVVEYSDVVLEVLDARDPLGCRCFQMEEAVLQAQGNKKLVLVLNKIGRCIRIGKGRKGPRFLERLTWSGHSNPTTQWYS